MIQRIVQLNSLREFQTEIPAPRRSPGASIEPTLPVVRLSLTESRRNGSGVPMKDIQLELMGVNGFDEIVWLHYGQNIVFMHGGEPAPGRDAAIYGGMRKIYDLVVAHLTGLGYEVRGGRYGIPGDVRPLRGQFECVRWKKDGDDSYRVVAAGDDE